MVWVATVSKDYKSLFQVRFLLRSIALLLFVLCLQKCSRTNGMNSLGGPYEIILPEGYYTFLILGVLISAFIVPAAIGLLVYGFLQWRHPGYQSSIRQSLLLSILVTWAWGLLGVVALSNFDGVYVYKPYYFLAHFLIQVGLTIIAARFGYYEVRTSKQPLSESTM